MRDISHGTMSMQSMHDYRGCCYPAQESSIIPARVDDNSDSEDSEEEDGPGVKAGGKRKRAEIVG